MHDDTDAGRLIPVDRPAFAIDYLGNGWCNEDDIAASWKFMTKQKNDLINGLRLENASWRNWAKQRHHLKTVSPRTLNWLKDSDTTWLYGPLYKASIDEFDLSRFGSKTIKPPTPPPTDPVLTGLKPVLKHKTASELFREDTLFHVQSDLKLDRKIEPNSKAQQTAIFKEHRQPKLRFNDSVEQCISIDADAVSDIELNDEDEDEDSGIIMRISTKRAARSIVRINPTKLKAGGALITEEDDPFDPANISSTRRSSYSDSMDYEDDLFANPSLRSEAISANYGGIERSKENCLSDQAEKGLGQKAYEIVSNVKDIVHWASSLVYNSSAF
ncbi:hypothetical protein BGW38_003833 [Lunasporangiospora selenospora]|uniref:Nitrogen regulatory protein areA GATA-like domain-containing protein n=1 Tax=Lunasporangiospora selenospora TaxID=979761 RepID=A0A9P6FQM3_9FUNG|nr:hypothetical protein BGW38_003833 [Lunasporangiospora selenospora]